MKYGRTLITLAALSLAACSSDKSPTTAPSAKSLDVIGTYKATSSPTTFKQYLTVDKSSVTMTAICKGYTKVVRVEVTAPARVTESSIEILADAQKSDKELTDCTAKLEKGVIAYEINQYKDLKLSSTSSSLPSEFAKLGVEKVGRLGRFKDSVMGFVGSAAALGKDALIALAEQQAQQAEAEAAASIEGGKLIVNGVKAADQQMRDGVGQFATKTIDSTKKGLHEAAEAYNKSQSEEGAAFLQ